MPKKRGLKLNYIVPERGITFTMTYNVKYPKDADKKSLEETLKRGKPTDIKLDNVMYRYYGYDEEGRVIVYSDAKLKEIVDKMNEEYKKEILGKGIDKIKEVKERKQNEIIDKIQEEIKRQIESKSK